MCAWFLKESNNYYEEGSFPIQGVLNDGGPAANGPVNGAGMVNDALLMMMAMLVL